MKTSIADTDSRKQLGNWGERVAVKYLTDYGHQVLVQNWRFGRMGELDAVTISPEGTLTAIEVKTGVQGGQVSPVSQLTPTKVNRLNRLMEAFILTHPHIAAKTYQVDGIVVEKRGIKAHIKHYRNLAA
jgi:putative endonuclease